MTLMKKLTEISAAHTLFFITGTLILLFFYAAISKLLDFETSKIEMMKQVFPKYIAMKLVWIVPVSELAVVTLLLFKSTQLTGLYAAALLMAAFSIYISVSMSGVFGWVPCSCGGILKGMSYYTHLAFNLFFLGIAVLGIAIRQRWIIIDGFT